MAEQDITTSPKLNEDLLNLTDPKKKGDLYCMANAKSIYNSFGPYYFNQRKDWLLNRKYSRGTQPIDKYKPMMMRDNEVQFDSLKWSVPKFMPKRFDILKGIISRLPLQMKCEALDPENISEKAKMLYIKEAEIRLREKIAELEKTSGVPLMDQENKYDSPEELQLDMEAGNIKLEIEIAMEEGIELMFDYWKASELRNALTQDMADCGFGVLRHEVMANGLIKIRRPRPESTITNYVTTRDFRELTKVGEERLITIVQLRKEAGDSFTEEQYVQIARNVAGKYSNPVMTNLGIQPSNYIQNGNYIYDKFLVLVFDVEWESTDCYTHIKDRPNKYGNKLTKKVGPKVKDAEAKQFVKSTDYTVWYGCKWLVGTDMVYGSGPIRFPNSKANVMNESASTFSICALDIDDMITSPLTSRVIDFVDDIVIAKMQLQSYMAKAIPPGVGADVAAMSNIPNGKGGSFNPLDLLDMHMQTGSMLFNSTLPDGRVIPNWLPILEMKGSDISQIAQWWTLINQSLNAINETLGLNDSTDASNADPEQSVAGQKLAYQGTLNSLQMIITAIDNIFEKTAEGIVNRMQHMAQKGELDYMADALGRKNLKALAFSEQIGTAALGVKIEPRMDETEKMYLEQNIQAALTQRGQTGVGGIEVEDAFAIRRVKNIKQAENLFILRRAKRAKEDKERGAMEQQNNAQVQQQSLVMASKMKQMEADQELNIYKQKKEIDFAYKQKELMLQGKLKENQIITQGEVDAHLQATEPKEKEAA